jgi:hypothetical protein
MAFGFQNVSGLLVEEMSGDSPAMKAGLKPGDRILSYDNKPPFSPAALDALQQNTFGKEEVVLQIWRAEESQSLIVPLGALESKSAPHFQGTPQSSTKGQSAKKAGRTREAIAKWRAAANLAAEPFLYDRVGEAPRNMPHGREEVCQKYGVTRDPLCLILFHARRRFQKQWPCDFHTHVSTI